MFLDDVEEKLDELNTDVSDNDALHAYATAKRGINRMRLQINLPMYIEVWNGQYSCPTCGKLFGNISDCDDEFKKKIMSRCNDCNQLLAWDLDEKSEDMTLLSLKEIVDGYCATAGTHYNLADVPVLVNLQEPSLGPGASDPVLSAYMGFDWEAGQFRLCTKNDIVHSKMKRDNAKKIVVRNYGKRNTYWCPNCSFQVSNKDEYCKHCGQKLEK